MRSVARGRPSILAVATALFAAACGSSPPKVASPASSPRTIEALAARASHLVLLVDGEDGLGLFADEAAEANALVAAWATSHGFRVVDPSRAEEVFSRARAGKDARSGAACGRPLARWSAAERWREVLGANGELHASVGCGDHGDACTLSVYATDAVGFHGDSVADLSAPFDPRAPWRDALRRALEALTPKPEDEQDAYGLGGIMGSGEPVKIRPDRVTFSATPARAADGNAAFEQALSFGDGIAPLRACLEGAQGVELLVDVDARGRIARCESRNDDDAASLCACEAFAGHATGALTVRGKRAYVGVHHQTADVVTPLRGVVRAWVRTHLEPYKDRRGQDLWRPLVSDPSITDWEPPTEDGIAQCFADFDRARDEVRMRVRVTFDGTGRAFGTEALPPKGSTVSHAAMHCVQKALLKSQAPCPAAPGATAEGELTVSVLPAAE